MKIRHVEFAMIPAWVIEHPAMQGQYTRLAVYVGLRYVGFKFPGRDWRSETRLAEAVGVGLGCPANTVRNNLMQLRADGLVVLAGGVISFPDDSPQPAGPPATGRRRPVPGEPTDDTSTPLEDIHERTNPVPAGGPPGADDLTLTGQPEPTPNQLANALMVTWWKRVQTETGKPPVAVSAAQFIKLTAPFFAAGYDAAAMENAVRALHEYGTPLTRQSVERELQGRGRPRGRRTVAEQLDELRYDAKGNLVTDE